MANDICTYFNVVPHILRQGNLKRNFLQSSASAAYNLDIITDSNVPPPSFDKTFKVRIDKVKANDPFNETLRKSLEYIFGKEVRLDRHVNVIVTTHLIKTNSYEKRVLMAMSFYTSLCRFLWF